MIETILIERRKTHGEFTHQAMCSQSLKHVVDSTDGILKLTHVQLEALDMILHKVARIVTGNPDHKDHWDDIAGYATLVSQRLAD